MRLRRFATPARALPVIAAVALLARLFQLGNRVAHQDEARVAHWILHYMEAGAWEYRAIIHGPFLPHVNGVVFDLLGPSDFTMRLVVAVVGGLFPLAAWLFRSRLDDVEVVLFGLVLAVNPVLVYYSRFMRNDLLLVAFSITAFGFFLRAVDTGKRRYLLVGAAVFGLATTTKENVLLFPVTWLGALALLFDYRLFRARFRGEDWVAVARADVRSVLGTLWRWKVPLVVAALEVAVVFVLFYAPLPDLYEALANPSLLPGVLSAATVGTAHKFLDLWGSTGMQEHSYLKFLGHLGLVVVAGGATTMAFSVVGFLGDRYGGTAEPRDLVSFAFYWGLASLFGYPIVSDIMAPWTGVYVLAPLAIPAAVGLRFVVRWLHEALATDDRPTAAIATALLLLAATASVGGAVTTSYVAPQAPNNPLVQYAQPSGDMKPVLHDIEDISRTNGGVDVLFFGGEFANPNDERTDATLDIETGGYPGWFARLPLPWYLEIYDANVSSTVRLARLDEAPPPVVITLEKHADEVGFRLDGYRRETHQGYLWGRPVVFFVDEDTPEPLTVPAINLER